MSKSFGYALITAAAMVAGALALPALAAGPGGGGGGGTSGGGGGGTAPTVVNYKITGLSGGPCPGGVAPLGYEQICAAFPLGQPYTLTYTVTTSTSAGLQNDNNYWCGATATDPNTNLKTTRTIAVFSKAVSNINLQFANGISYVAPGQSGDVSLENDTCLATGVWALDQITITAKSLSGPNSFPGFSGGTATVSYLLFLADMASFSDPNSPLPPTELTSLNLATAAPEAHLLQANTKTHGIFFRFPTAGSPSWGVGLQISTFEVVP